MFCLLVLYLSVCKISSSLLLLFRFYFYFLLFIFIVHSTSAGGCLKNSPAMACNASMSCLHKSICVIVSLCDCCFRCASP